MAVDIRSRYFAEPEETLMPDYGDVTMPFGGLSTLPAPAPAMQIASTAAPMGFMEYAAPAEVVPPIRTVYDPYLPEYKPSFAPPALQPTAEQVARYNEELTKTGVTGNGWDANRGVFTATMAPSTPMAYMPAATPSSAIPMEYAPPAEVVPPVQVRPASPLPPASEEVSANTGLTPQQLAEVQASIANMDLSNIGLTGGLGLIGGYGPPGLDESKYMVNAPLSNKGNPTSTLSKSTNQFFVYDNQPVRLVDNATGQVVFEGSGPEDARKASELAAQLTAQGGRKAAWDIQTGPGIDLSGFGAGQETGWKTVANEKKNKSTLGVIGDVLGTALPVAVGFIPGFGQLATGLQIAAGAGAGAAGAGLRGDNILKGAVMGGLSSAGGTIVGDALRSGTNLGANAARAIGTGIGTTAGGLVTGQNLQNALLGGVASGGLTYLGGEAFGKRGGTTGDTSGSNIGTSGVELGDIVVTGGIPRFSGAVFTPSFADKAQLNSDQADPYGTGNFAVRTPVVDDSLVVTGSRGPTTGSMAVNVSPGTSGLTRDELVVTGERAPTTGSTTVNLAPGASPSGLTKEELVVTGERKPDTGSTTVNLTPSTSGLTKDELVVTGKKDVDTTSSSLAVGGPDIPVRTDEIVVTGKKPVDTTTSTSVLTIPGGVTVPKDIIDLAEKGPGTEKKSDLDKITDYMKLLGLAIPLLGGGGGGGSAGTYSSKRNLGSTFSAKLPTPGTGGAFTVGGLGARTPGAGGTFSARPATDWYRYGMGPAMDIPAGTDLSGATSPYAGYGPGTLGQETFRRVSGGYAPFAARPQLLPNMVSSLGRDATSGQIEAALAGAKTAEEARQINPGTAYFNIDAATAQALGDPSLVGTVMSIQDLQRRMAARPMAHGGSMGYARGSSRESFAVEGPGTGRSDDIPAVLSDGEYVIDAETVALLGDGSSKAGAKKLDEMRVKVRKHKGKNLAKGKFSVDAKHPEAYMSGGRI